MEAINRNNYLCGVGSPMWIKQKIDESLLNYEQKWSDLDVKMLNPGLLISAYNTRRNKSLLHNDYVMVETK